MRRDGIELTTGFTATVNAELRVGSVEETITVTGATPIVDTQNVRSQNVLTRELLDTIPTGKSLPAYAALTLGATSGQDVGGTRGELNTVISIHGNRGTDMKQMVDGMPFHQMASSGAGTSRYYMVNQALAQEVVLETGGMSAESTTGGVQMNVVPKDGGNKFTTYINASGSHPALQSSNLTDDLRARGATSMNDLRKIYDIGGGFGGPIKRDRLWFYTAHRKWGASEYMPGNYFNLTPHTLFYSPDLSRRAYQDVNNQDHSVRFTWQAASKHKFTAYTAIQNNCLCYQLLVPEGHARRAADARLGHLFRVTALCQESDAGSRDLPPGSVDDQQADAQSRPAIRELQRVGAGPASAGGSFCRRV